MSSIMPLRSIEVATGEKSTFYAFCDRKYGDDKLSKTTT
jgi:hypothetical protein